MAEPMQLTAAECEELLRGTRIGRVAVTTADGPHVIPVNYALLDHSVVFRTSPHSVVGTYARDSLIGFEIDQVDDAAESGWSVLARGRATVVTDPDEVRDIRAAWEAAPWASGTRNLFFRLRWSELTGRRLVPIAAARPA